MTRPYRWDHITPKPITFGRVLWWLFRPFGLVVFLIVLTVFAPGWWRPGSDGGEG